MDEQSLSHTKWKWQYHIVIVPKYRRKAIYGKLRHVNAELKMQENAEEIM